MQDLYNLFEKFLSIVKVPITGWTVAFFVILYFLRNRIARVTNNLLDLMSRKVATGVGSRRFESKYKEYIRATHLHLKIVGIRTEEERRPEISEAYVPIKLLQKGESIDDTVFVDQIVRDNSYNLILGDPGAGKSTILDYLIVIGYTEPLTRQKTHTGRAFVPRLFRRQLHTPCPIYVPLRRCSAKNKTLLADIVDEETEILPLPVHQTMPKRFIEYCVEQGNAILFLDGLDEVADEDAYHLAVRKVNEFIQLYPKTKIVVTCRKAGWRGNLNPDFQIYSVLPLDSQQQYQFVHKWYAAMLRYTSHGIVVQQYELQRRAEREANHLLTLLQTKERLRELASNPLILSLICLVHKQRTDLPRGRAALYRDCLDILLELWDRTDKEFDQTYPTTDQKKQLLRRIAYRMHSSGVRELDRHSLENWVLEFLPSVRDRTTPAEIVRQIEVRSGLMVERSIDRLAFSHLTFQEFLVVEYFNSEQNGSIELNTITDWSAWREPVLLMCGMKNTPTPFIETLFSTQPLLALFGISEAEPTKLDVRRVQRIVDSVIEQVERQRIKIDQAIPGLVELLSVEGNPFGKSIIELIYSRIRGYNKVEVSSLVAELSKIPTRESAKTLLSLLTRVDLSRREDILLNGLARIGNPAIYEALEWRERNDISELQLFNLLVSCYTPFASETLWRRYELTPPQGKELIWAKSWALRLADQEHDQVVRPFSFPGPGLSDPTVWPYRQNDKCAVAAIAKKVYSHLSSIYHEVEDVENDLDTFSRFSLRLQVPLLIQADGIKGYDPHDNVKRALHLEGSRYRYLSPFDKHSLYTISNFFQAREKRSIWTKVVMWMGIIIEVASVLAVSAGIISLLPPDANLLHFWIWLPFAAKIAIPAVIVVAMVVVYWQINFSPHDWDWEDVLETVILVLGICVIPMVWFYIFLTDDSQETIETMISLKKINWVALLYVLGGSLLVAVFGYLAIRHWVTNSISPYVGIASLTIIALLGIFLEERSLAFSTNRLAIWLEGHPRGSEVLDELTRDKK